MWEIGQRGEEIALRYLIKRGYRLLEHNYRAGHKEIDLIMEDGPCLVFVEVKARRLGAMVAGREALNSRKQAKLLEAAQYYLLEKNSMERICRFDLCEVELESGCVEHFINAFEQ